MFKVMLLHGHVVWTALHCNCNVIEGNALYFVTVQFLRAAFSYIFEFSNPIQTKHFSNTEKRLSFVRKTCNNKSSLFPQEN